MDRQSNGPFVPVVSSFGWDKITFDGSSVHVMIHSFVCCITPSAPNARFSYKFRWRCAPVGPFTWGGSTADTIPNRRCNPVVPSRTHTTCECVSTLVESGIYLVQLTTVQQQQHCGSIVIHKFFHSSSNTQQLAHTYTKCNVIWSKMVINITRI